MKNLLSAFESVKWSIRKDFLSFDHFSDVVRNKIEWTSSPGYPYLLRATSNGIYFNVKNGIPDENRLLEVYQVVMSQINDRSSDPIRLFIKQEPLKHEKLDSGRYRLISSVSIIDQIIDHMLFDDMNDMITDDWMFVPPKIGWSAFTGGWKFMPKLSEQPWALDKSSWDWTVNLWLFDIVLDMRIQLCKNLSREWVDLALWRYSQLYIEPIFVTTGGLLLKQITPGVMKSGCVNTIVDNSIMQVILHLRVCFEEGIRPDWLFSLGDDTLQKKPAEPERYLRAMSKYAIVKQAHDVTEFAGHRFDGIHVEPVYRSKHSYILLHMDPANLEAMANSYCLLYHRSVYRDVIRDLFAQMGAKLPNLRELDLIFDGM
ncbi:hypothetical protein 2 [Hubei sobemo-like virus 30]|uniref:hypothetical protein 2 n=1 Tax=Hubei sobemo-like virus 30 TaxID=1923217 RepID=UPI000909D385|nr:hypothetical protein 2 [Hubei sobemo-like virus 30]APG75773.1 hypothetical protein 2 [Hubei sobemo-like virus 30]